MWVRNGAYHENTGRIGMQTTRDKSEKRDLELFAARIDEWEQDGKQWAARGNERMANTHEDDVLYLRAVYTAIEEGDYGKAARLAAILDTAVREQIPVRLYNAISQSSAAKSRKETIMAESKNNAGVKNRAEETAAECYAARQQDIGVLLDLIAEELRIHANSAAKGPKNWGFAGDLGRIRENLKDVLESLLVGRHKWLEAEASKFIEDHLESMRKA